MNHCEDRRPGPNDGGCRAFLRQLGDHVAAAAAGTVPSHAAVCEACGRRLKLAVGIARGIRAPVAFPPRLHDPAFLGAIYERFVEDAESGALGRTILSKLPDVPRPATLPWPEQEAADEAVAQQLVEPSDPAPPWLWLRVREEIAQTRMAGARLSVLRRRAVWVAAAATLLISALAWDLMSRQGTLGQPEIVFVTVTEMPLVQYPTAALRQGHLR